MQLLFSLDGLGQAGRRDQLSRSFFFDRFNPQRRTGVAIRLQLFGFHAHVAKLSKVLIKGRHWYVLSHRGGGDQTVDKVSLRSLIAVQRFRASKWTVTSPISTPGLEIKPPSAEAIAARGCREKDAMTNT